MTVPDPTTEATFDRATDNWGKRPHWTRDEIDRHRDLEQEFREWAEGHGGIWFDTDSRLAAAIAGVLDIELRWG